MVYLPVSAGADRENGLLAAFYLGKATGVGSCLVLLEALPIDCGRLVQLLQQDANDPEHLPGPVTGPASALGMTGISETQRKRKADFKSQTREGCLASAQFADLHAWEPWVIGINQRLPADSVKACANHCIRMSTSQNFYQRLWPAPFPA